MVMPLPGGRRLHVAEGELKETLLAWIKEGNGAEKVARHEHAVKHRKYYVPIDIAYIGAMARGVRKLAGSPFRAKYKPAETCPVCVLVAAVERARVEEMRQRERAYEGDARRRQAYADDPRRVTYIVQRDDESPDTFHVVTDQGETVESFSGTIEHQGQRTDARTRALGRGAELNRT